MKNIKTVKNSWQQGDVLLRKLAVLPKGARTTLSKGRCVLAHGESGHSHVVEDDEAELIQIGERLLLTITKNTPVKHEEHSTRTLSPGIWEISGVREFDWFSKMIRRVLD